MNYLIISLILLATISVNHGWTENDRVSVLSSVSSNTNIDANANKLLMEAGAAAAAAAAASSVLNSKNATNSTKSSGNKNESINNGKLISV